MTHMPDLTTERLVVRPFSMDDAQAYTRVFAEGDGPGEENAPPEWFEWARRNPQALGGLGQPPYGDRAVCLRESGELIGAVGFVPCLMPFEMLAEFAINGEPSTPVCSTPEFGLF